VVEITEYVDLRGTCPFARWRNALDAATRARITVALDRVEQGNFASAKSVGAGVSELRLDFGPGYRIYFGREGERLVILLGGGTKSRQQADIKNAQALWQEYKNTKSKRT
jgi:putative addiction module killer protein